MYTNGILNYSVIVLATNLKIYEVGIYKLYEMPLASPSHESGQREIGPSGVFHLHHTMMFP